MICSINDKVREEIFKLDINDIDSYFDNLTEEKRDFVFRILLSDLCKMDFYEEFFHDRENDCLIFRHTPEELIKMFKQDKELLSLLVNTSVVFHKSDMLQKIMIMDQIEFTNKDKYFSEINKFHFLDKISYEFEYNLEAFKIYYLDYLKVNMNVISNQDTVSQYIAMKILDLKNTDCNKYRKFILEFIKVYYKWNLFQKDHELKEPRTKEDYDYLGVVQKSSMKKILNDLDNDYKFLATIIRNYLYFSTVGAKEKENEVETYFIENTDLKVQKKLKRDFN